MRELSLFSGAGGGLLAGKLLGWEHIGYVEWDDHCQQVIAQRIKDGILDEAPIFGDVRAFLSEGYAKSYQGMVDVLTAGFPCQPFSQSGHNKGGRDDRNMWPETFRIIRAVRPKWVYLENVPNILIHEYIRRIFGDLASMGLHARWCCLGSGDLGSVCESKRLWVVATEADCTMPQSMDFSKYIQPCEEESCRRQYTRAISAMLSQNDYTDLKRNTDAVARGMVRLKAIGNGQVPRVAATAWRMLSE